MSVPTSRLELEEGRAASTPISHATERIAGSFREWLDAQAQVQPESPVFWAPRRMTPKGLWTPVRGVEHLAVLISTAIRPDCNACLTSGADGLDGRTTAVIGLIERDTLGWAVNIFEGQNCMGDVRHGYYTFDNYESFGALAAAEASWSWVVSGRVPEGLRVRPPSW